jgi:hypothetical protein
MTMMDEAAPVALAQEQQGDNFMQFSALEGAGEIEIFNCTQAIPALCKESKMEFGPVTFLFCWHPDTWPICGKMDQQCYRYHCLCAQAGCRGEYSENLNVQYCCLKCTYIPEIKLSIITGIPVLEDENFCRLVYCCCDYGLVKFKLNFQYFCLTLNLGDGPQVAANTN